ncbi:DNA polymerase III subunit gamma/tau [Paraglaciecola sp. L3A3]|uniref:DNA polymerase III subunit gamma/tau n=1 Tax=Paraglaciecola sp. L3A3 TaxID=2686358 RepID=UPI00131AEEB5|nr:DNA polymerase III subunit gamma/tau [Paraglaciecola sp. L3A3]
MSYQVLARKWRPNRFAELVGQEHVVTAISNALDNNRLHHAYLFTGTRGVGKTTIARIFSKSLNCEQGLSATPCGQCGTCQEIENGNYIDLLEIDAASRTKVEDTRELLDNVQYKPSRGRYKVYLIDEVHMLSKHSFNALLKTLEEPPPHVKFLLATTDPQKLPVTILSRCLQFNLKALSRGQIAKQLDYVLSEESLQFDKDALTQLARAAQGSMRDALSLTDQAIAQGNGFVGLQIVTDMLGLMDKNQVLKLVHAVVQKDSSTVMQQVELMAMQAPDFSQILAEIMSLLHQVALTQFVPDACKLETISARAIYQLAKSVPAEQIQLLYQIALTGKKDLPYGADPRTSLEMTLLRMLAFCPDNLQLDPTEIVAQTPAAPQISSPSAAHAQQQASTDDTPIGQTVSQIEPVAELPLVEPAAEVIPEAQQTASSQQNNQQYTQQSAEQNLFEQQQDILAEAQDMGFQDADYNELQPVTLEDSYSQNSVPENQQAVVDNTPAPATSSTQDLIALRNRLKQNQSAQEENSEQVKKSERTELPNLASIREQNQSKQTSSANIEQQQSSAETDNHFTKQETTELTAPLNQPVDPVDNNQERVISAPVEPELQVLQSETEHIPPWALEAVENNKLAPEFDSNMPVDEDIFDPNAHLDEANVGEVTLVVPAFLPNNQKVHKSMQLDEWSKLIDDMKINALTKQLALHSSFHREGNRVTLTLLEGKEHLNSPTAHSLLQQALCSAFNSDIQLEIVMGQPINTPYALQIKINQVRQEYAHHVIKTDLGIQLLQQRFAANVIEQSVQAR